MAEEMRLVGQVSILSNRFVSAIPRGGAKLQMEKCDMMA